VPPLESLGEEWQFLHSGEATNGEASQGAAVGQALYSMQSASRSIEKEPDFSFLTKQTFYTTSALMRVRLTILADGSIIQVTIMGSGSGSAELDRLLTEALLAASFNDVTAQRKATQIGVLTIRFS
jgi:hypothetical protein